jgi:HD-GYP domain-containing protein (c-di-GMP phosphodiesterase class II)
MEMNNLRSEEFSFLAKIISLFLGFLLLIRTYSVWIAERHIIRPVNSIAHVSRHSGYDTPEAREKWLRMLDALNIQTGDEIETLYKEYKTAARNTVRYIEETQRKSGQLTKMQNGLILVLADMVESRDQCTGDHVYKTAAYTEIILRQMQKEGIYADKLSEAYITEVVNSAPLHDVGKITVSDVILNKPGKLTDEEFHIMQSHTTEGGKIIDKAMALVDEDSGYLNEAKNLALCHHEKWNGKGYPAGLKGEEIPLSARVMAVADVFDALVSRRSYKEPFTIEKALDIIRHDAGTHFDPLVARAFLDAEEEVRSVAKLKMDID